ncbi:MraY family glycosyltransferase [Pseudomonas alkylphenolica]|uniref:UDP-N-acetylmuramyl pentapeptide phosphotransferase/UDP-N-acetylglucosamine-1-phosphate transferase n=1 Tax=Pseudomonas alkylphenolica TaxID=237609 RepID=A0A077F9W8_9PSED|nr:glycosyltransferase family 4 protein [Pseudomonas alkylphenolica]AIL60624.1 UDP-N-acetylmuramyl pentapeptide phosphotransferase/UDP-N-acetylglucosamine-1-phosphate transferase [Pseudomonas alkylphenolica]
MSLLILLPLIGVLSFFLTAGLRLYALRRSLLDIPNIRSSHSVPTPRGGGVAIVVSFSVALVVMYAEAVLSTDAFWALAGAGLFVAGLGFLDDHGHVPARWRLLGHFIAAAWAMACFGGAPAIYFAGVSIGGVVVNLLMLFYLVWLLNLYNFMDGIDGIASIEALSVCFGAALMYWVSDVPGAIAPLLLLAVAVGGFLYWNFPPARIFMGDAGSGFLGITLGVFSLQAAWVQSSLFWGWVILLGVFVVDATVTLVRRMLLGERVYEAHRSHAYQYASRQYGKHLPITIAVTIINLFWLAPLALAVAMGKLDGGVGVLIAYLPLLLIALKFNAGKPEQRV